MLWFVVFLASLDVKNKIVYVLFIPPGREGIIYKFINSIHMVKACLPQAWQLLKGLSRL